MLKLVVQTFLTLDGVYQAPGAEDEDPSGGFKYGGWQMQFWDADGDKAMSQQIAETDALLLGRLTYDIFSAYWPMQPDSEPIAKKFNAIPKFVFSKTLKKADWKGTSILSGAVAEGVQKARSAAGSGILAVVGSGKLAQSLMKEGLVDEYRLWIHPIMLGSGKRLFADGITPQNVRLTESRITPSGVVMLTYKPAAK